MVCYKENFKSTRISPESVEQDVILLMTLSYSRQLENLTEEGF